MEESRKCATCKAFKAIEEFRHGRAIVGFRRNCRACRNVIQKENYRRVAEERAETTGAHEARICKDCGKEKPLDAYRMIRGKYRLLRCDVCRKVKDREYQRSEAARRVKYATRKGRRKSRVTEIETEKKRIYRATPIGKLVSAIHNRKGRIGRSPGSPSVPRWREEIRQCEDRIAELRRNLDGRSKTGPKPPGYGSIRIPDPKA